MPTNYTVKKGDCLSSIAADFGLPNWQTIYNYPDNAAFKAKRKDPNVIYPGDKLVIPDKAGHTENGATGQRHKFVYKREKVMLRIRLQDDDGNALSNKKFDITIDGEDFSGSTDGSGLLQRKIPATASGAELTLFLSGGKDDPGVLYPLALGDLDPSDTTSGAVQRLNNLGYDCTADDMPAYQAAVSDFQKKYNLDVTGVNDQPTADKLRFVHDGVS